MPNPPNLITNRPTYVPQAQPDLTFKSKNIKESEIFDQLALYCQNKPVLVREFFTEQIHVAIKRFENSNMPVHIYFPVNNLKSPPDFLLTLLTKYNKSENNLVLHNLSGEFIITSEFISALEKTEFTQEITFEEWNDEDCNHLHSEEFFCKSLIEYAEEIDNENLKKIADIFTMEIFLSNADLHESNFFDFRLLQIDTQRMAEKNYFYHIFKTNDIFDVFRDKKFHDFANSSSSQAEFNFIFGTFHSLAVSVQKKDDKLSFIVINCHHFYENITLEKFENNSKTLPILMNTSNLKIINIKLQTQLNPYSSQIFSRDSIFNLLKNKQYLNELHETGEYGKSITFDSNTNISVTDMVNPGSVRFSQDSDITNKYKTSLKKRNLLDMNVIKNQSNKPQTLEQYLSQHSRNEDLFNPFTNQVETKYRNKADIDKRIKLFISNSDYLSGKSNIDNNEMRSHFKKYNEYKSIFRFISK